ncbi:glycoside hydrolase family 43 protein [Daejeonella sp.]|uniref:glycoside hydrolase family 43 protein n=1 Tax=Daejeonella sp. TaxID=2805397 RepID=UPI0030C0C338
MGSEEISQRTRSSIFLVPLKRCLLVCILLYCVNLQSTAQLVRAKSDTIFLADPTIFSDKNVYYLYGTGSSRGFLVYRSTDLETWEGPVGKRDGHALLKGDSYGSKGFWAPQVFRYKKKYYMAYTADEQIAIAESDNPLGPFVQKEFRIITGPGKQIDPFIFIDKGKIYLYHVRLTEGNRIYVAQLKDDLSDIVPGTAVECVSATQPWENTANANWPVAEGPTVIRRDKLYYLFYSANDFRNIDYGMGYATSLSPTGPWIKFENNPVISRHNVNVNGPGHGDFFKGPDGGFRYVFHTHNSGSRVSPRVTVLVIAQFIESAGKPKRLVIDTGSIRALMAKDIEKQ